MEIKMSLIPGKTPGTVGKINVKVGETVEAGTILANVETHKGNKVIKSSTAGVVTKILFAEGDSIKTGQALFEIDEAERETQLEAGEKISIDLLIIGGGPGGYVAAIYAAQHGLSVVLAEKKKLGGTCLNVGCIPTKALVKSAEIFHTIQNAEEFGIKLDGIATPDMEQIIERKDRIVKQLVDGVEYLMEKNNIRVIRGEASFASETKVVAVEDGKAYEIAAKDIIIATGSKISKFNLPGADLPFVKNSNQALSDTKLPKSITIIGGGIIGMEFAFIYRHLGAEVTVIKRREQLFDVKDDEVMIEIKQEAAKAGIKIITGAKFKEIKQSDDGLGLVVFEEASGERTIDSEQILVTTGREANLDGLGYEKAGIIYDEKRRGIAVDSHMRTNKEHIYAIGDVTNIIQLAHIASHQGMVAVKNIIGEETEMDYSAVPEIVFTSPEIASVGEGETSLKEQGREYKVGRFSFEANGKALTEGEASGFIKLIADESTDRLIGATIIGPDASTLIATATVAIRNGLTATQLAETIFAHPTTSEVIHEAALDLGLGALHQ